MMLTNRLAEGDCFFYLDEQDRVRAESSFRTFAELGGAGKELEGPLLGAAMKEHASLYAEPHIVWTRVRKTGDVVSRRITDGKFFIWYDDRPTEVQEAPGSRQEFETRLELMKKEKAQFNKQMKELDQKNRKSKKMNKDSEIVDRTEVLRV